MVEIGKLNTLRINRTVDFGAYLDGQEHGEILIPLKYLPESFEIDDLIEVMVYTDTEDRLVATTEIPKAKVGEFAFLKAVSITTVGAFLDWGLIKDLFVPYQEQKLKMEEGRSYYVYLYLDTKTNRVVASAKIEKFLDNLPHNFKENQEVQLGIYEETDLGFKAIINNTHSGVIYKNEVFQKLKKGDLIKGYIKKIRIDEKIDLSLQKVGYGIMDDVSEIIIEALKKSGGFLAITDKTSPEIIYQILNISKKNYKKAVGILYKSRIITLESDGIKLV